MSLRSTMRRMSASVSPPTPASHHVGALDGLRGLAALWVFLSHVQILCGLRAVPVLAWGDLAVDLFMMISGFLMAHNALTRQSREPWEDWGTWRTFWGRRLFRIAPAYYLLLAVALACGPLLGHFREAIAVPFPDTMTARDRYADASIVNIFNHVTFVFGLRPEYAFRTPLPDWSIGLEMQFYAVFPFLMLALGRTFSLWRHLLVLAAGLGVWALLWEYAARFPMPAFLPMKLHVFLLGVALARARLSVRGLGPWWVVAVVCGLECARHPDVHGLAFALMAGGFGVLVAGPGAWPGLIALRRWLASAPGQRAGDYAYSFYLVHLLVLLPVAGTLAASSAYLALPAWERFLICAVLAGGVSLGLCMLLHRYVEQPGITWGKRWLSRRARTVTAVSG